jgi:hypothetical protein
MTYHVCQNDLGRARRRNGESTSLPFSRKQDGVHHKIVLTRRTNMVVMLKLVVRASGEKLTRVVAVDHDRGFTTFNSDQR